MAKDVLLAKLEKDVQFVIQETTQYVYYVWTTTFSLQYSVNVKRRRYL